MLAKRPDLATAQYQLLSERHQERAAFDMIWGMSFHDTLRRVQIDEAITMRWTDTKSDTIKEKKIYSDKILGTDWPIFVAGHDEAREQIEAGWLLDTVDPIVTLFSDWLIYKTDKPHYQAVQGNDTAQTWMMCIAQRVVRVRILERKLERTHQGNTGFADLEVCGRMQQMMLLRQAVAQGARGVNFMAKGDTETYQIIIDQFKTTCEQLLTSAFAFPYQPLPAIMPPQMKEIA